MEILSLDAGFCSTLDIREVTCNLLLDKHFLLDCLMEKTSMKTKVGLLHDGFGKELFISTYHLKPSPLVSQLSGSADSSIRVELVEIIVVAS